MLIIDDNCLLSLLVHKSAPTGHIYATDYNYYQPTNETASKSTVVADEGQAIILYFKEYKGILEGRHHLEIRLSST